MGNAPGTARVTLTGTTRATDGVVEARTNAGSLEIVNSGTIIDTGNGDGIDVEGPVAVLIVNTGSIATTTGTGIAIDDATSATIRSTAIAGQGGTFGIAARTSGAVDLVSGTITGYASGISLSGRTVRMDSARLEATGGFGIAVFAAEGAAIVNSGSLTTVGEAGAPTSVRASASTRAVHR
ncbi:hypothetical protein AB5I41_13385 [Sphingomonas sp. MMS24-JH45]